MTASDPRVGEIEARLAAIVTPQPWEAKPYRAGFGGDQDREPDFWDISDMVVYEKEDAEFIAAAPADVAYLLAELRKAHEESARLAAVATRYRDERRKAREALARVEGVADEFDAKAGHRWAAARLRVAVAAANGDGQ